MRKHIVIIFVIILSAIFVGGAFWSTYGTQKRTATANNILSLKETGSGEVRHEDFDEDGLLDWEEDLWGTDPNQKDTDKDGTEDGEEVKVGRSPKVAGPKDSISLIQNSGSASSTSEKDLTPTEKIGRELFINYMELKKGGVTFDEVTTEKMVTEIVQNMIGNGSYRVYSSVDLMLSGARDAEDIKAYGNNIVEISNNHRVTSENELVIFGNFIDSENKKELEKLVPWIESYKAILKEEASLPVPQSAVELHIELLNAISSLEASLENMHDIPSPDYLMAVAAIERHVGAARRLEDALLAFKTYFAEENVVFQKNDAGYQLFNGI